jgi:hypothetical protein
MIAEQTALGVTGLRIGLSYEARAEIALWTDDAAAFERFAKLTAREYRHGARCPLGARYDRLTHEARRRGIVPSAALSDFETTTVADSSAGDVPDLQTAVRIALAGAGDAHDRYLRALRMVCSSRAARGGHLFLPANHGPQLVASCDLAPPAAQLNDLVRDYLSEQEDRFDTLTIALDHDVPVGPTSTIPTASVDGIDYELMLLTCQQDNEARIAGIMAIVAGETPRTNPRQSQLLSTIAAHLVSGT